MVRPFRKYPRGKYWKQQSKLVWERAAGKCEVTGEPLKRWACHHIIGERWARKMFPGSNVHVLGNLIAVTAQYHAKLTAIENHLKRADWLSFRTELYRWSFPLEKLDAAYTALLESVKK